MSALIQYIQANYTQILSLTLEHVELTLFAILVSMAIGVPLGILISYFRPAKKPVMAFANLIQAIPSMALLGFMIPLFGIGTKPAIVMVVMYSLLPIIKNTVAGLANINSETVEAAKGIGLTNAQILFKVKLPLAAPVIMAGIRISAVSAVGLMTLAAFIGAGGLGYLVYAGIRTINTTQILAGAIPACLLALLIDYLASILERIVTPKSFQLNDIRKPWKNVADKIVLCVIAVALAGSMIYSALPASSSDKVTITIGSMDFTEQEVLSYMIKYYLEDNTNVSVQQKLSLGSGSIVLSALQKNEIDMYVDYTGTIYGSIFNLHKTSDTDEVYNQCVKLMKSKYDLNVLDPLGFNNTYTLATTKAIAKKYNLTTISDLAKVSDQFTFTPTLTFLERSDCLKALVKKYNISFKKKQGIDGSPRYTALMNGSSMLIDAYSTDGLLKKYDLVVLKDDKQAFPPYHAVPVVNNRIESKCPKVVTLLNKLKSYLNESVMINLNYQVDCQGKKSAVVVKAFLKSKGLIK